MRRSRDPASGFGVRVRAQRAPRPEDLAMQNHRSQRPQLPPGRSSPWSSSASTAASPTTSTRRWPAATAVARRRADARQPPDRRLRGAELHQSQQPLDRHRRAARGARHLRQLLLRPRRGRRSDDERPAVPARRTILAAFSRGRRQGRGGHRQGQAAQAPRPWHARHLLLRGEGRPGERGRERHRRACSTSWACRCRPSTAPPSPSSCSPPASS